jgi:hypothetical protein
VATAAVAVLSFVTVWELLAVAAAADCAHLLPLLQTAVCCAFVGLLRDTKNMTARRLSAVNAVMYKYQVNTEDSTLPCQSTSDHVQLI